MIFINIASLLSSNIRNSYNITVAISVKHVPKVGLVATTREFSHREI